MSEDERRCLTCGDLAEPMRVAALEGPGTELAVCVGKDGGRSVVDIGLVPDAAPGESLLVHAGAALARLPRDPGAGD
jgi:hydrogenase maturation factor